ncbi:hypothetical protein [Microbulbifer rhizosphaerae]|uniref:Uncharacterized protein n=1 Tax=Microbulbifer rhizosphaerae TaxID=1562603 RepID=A0A7W4ZAZ2_9GAMM|nr:hypothetical protein [Microbulbifer rhizosphaerae]MBB3061765.1 hypothetical protein [Microbulbifer rhizosphaerae]
MSNFHLELAQSELKIVLEALTEMEARKSAICETSDNEDEIADIGNELIELRLLLKPLRERAINEYGNNIVNFSRELL